MSRKSMLLAAILTCVGLAVLSGCPPNAYHLVTLTVTPMNAGEVRIDPVRAAYFAGTDITIEALPYDGFVFQNWVGFGINTTANPIKLRVYSDQTITAVFGIERIQPGTEGEGESAPSTQIVKDGGFELGAESPEWTAVSATGVPIICNASDCGLLNGIGPASGSHWAWFGNSAILATENATLIQQVDVSRNSGARLVFNVAVPLAENPFGFSVFLNRRLVWAIDQEDAADYQSYRYISVNLGNYSADRSDILSFVYSSFGTAGQQSAVFLDNVAIETDAP